MVTASRDEVPGGEGGSCAVAEGLAPPPVHRPRRGAAPAARAPRSEAVRGGSRTDRTIRLAPIQDVKAKSETTSKQMLTMTSAGDVAEAVR
ncbi:hypothetical protein GCM10009727_92520 [Actinomadura napierensis]|uniref:FXSXX-COOH protein n=1 Tax=Actinomadura napierensis TaxID=267854 RepID=A0ABN3AI22_9ACTN